MENQVRVFTNEQFGEVRTVEENGKVMFCGSDVAKALISIYALLGQKEPTP